MFLNWIMCDQFGKFDASKLAVRLMVFGVILYLVGSISQSKGSDPTFTVVNRCPAFTVVNKVPQRTSKPTYDDLIVRVKAGKVLTVAVGVSDAADFHLDSIPQTAPGVWKCFMRDGVPMMEEVPKPVPVQIYRPVQSFAPLGST